MSTSPAKLCNILFFIPKNTFLNFICGFICFHGRKEICPFTAISPPERPLAAPSLVDEVAKLAARVAQFLEWVFMVFFMSNGLCNIAGMDADLGKEVPRPKCNIGLRLFIGEIAVQN